MTVLGISLGFQAWRDSRNAQKSDITKILTRIDALEKTTVELTTKVAPFWSSLQSKLADALTRPTHREMDKLLAKLQDLSITDPERVQLNGMLDETLLDPETTEEFRNLARLLITAMPLVVQEAAGELKTTAKAEA